MLTAAVFTFCMMSFTTVLLVLWRQAILLFCFACQGEPSFPLLSSLYLDCEMLKSTPSTTD